MEPVHSIGFWPNFAAALGIPADLPVQKAVLVIPEDDAVTLYLKVLPSALKAQTLLDKVKVNYVEDVTVDDCTVVVTPLPEPPK